MLTYSTLPSESRLGTLTVPLPVVVVPISTARP